MANWLDPMLMRLLEISRDVLEGRADDETVKAWEAARESMMTAFTLAERMLARHEPNDRARVMKRWMEEFAEEQRQTPVQH